MGFCPQCGQPDPGYPNCRRCGAPQYAPPPPPPVYVVRQESDGLAALIIALVIILLLVIPAIIVLLFFGALGAACSAAALGAVPVAWGLVSVRRNLAIRSRGRRSGP